MNDVQILLREIQIRGWTSTAIVELAEDESTIPGERGNVGDRVLVAAQVSARRQVAVQYPCARGRLKRMDGSRRLREPPEAHLTRLITCCRKEVHENLADALGLFTSDPVGARAELKQPAVGEILH